LDLDLGTEAAEEAKAAPSPALNYEEEE